MHKETSTNARDMLYYGLIQQAMENAKLSLKDQKNVFESLHAVLKKDTTKDLYNIAKKAVMESKIKGKYKDNIMTEIEEMVHKRG